MSIDDLIEELQKVKLKHGNIPIYHWIENQDEYPELYHYDGKGFEVKKIYLMNYISEEYDQVEDKVVEYEKTEICCAEFGEKIEKDAKELHVGLII